MANSLAFNPVITTNALGSFNVQSEGLIQGTAYPDPAIRNALAGGYLDPAEVLPMWGGVGISALIPTRSIATPLPAIGAKISRALTVAAQGTKQLIGFSVFDQAHNMVNSPQSPVPVSLASMMVNYYKLGSRARIALAIDPVLISLEGDLISSLVSWDFTAQRIVPYTAAYAANVITNAVWAAGQITFTTTSAHGLAVGSVIDISGFTPSAYNGTYTTLAGTAGSTIVVAKAADPGADTVQGQLDAGGGALPCTILEVQASNCMAVAYDTVTGFCTWNRDGAAAVVQI